MLWPSPYERGGFGTEPKCFRGCERGLGEVGSTEGAMDSPLLPAGTGAMSQAWVGHEAAAEEPAWVLQVSSPCSDYKLRGFPTGMLVQSIRLRHLFCCHHTTCPVTQGWVSDLDLLPCFCGSKLHLPHSLHLPLPFLLSFALCFPPCGSFPGMS